MRDLQAAILRFRQAMAAVPRVPGRLGRTQRLLGRSVSNRVSRSGIGEVLWTVRWWPKRHQGFEAGWTFRVLEARSALKGNLTSQERSDNFVGIDAVIVEESAEAVDLQRAR